VALLPSLVRTMLMALVEVMAGRAAAQERDGPWAFRDGGHRLRVGADTAAGRATCGVGAL